MRTSEEPWRSSQLDRIEGLLLQQNSKLDELTRIQLQPSVVSLRQLLLSSSSTRLRSLADCLLQLAAGQPCPQLDVHLQAIFGAEGTYEQAEEQLKPQSTPSQTSPAAANPLERRQPTVENVQKHLLTAAKELLEETETIEMDTAQRLREVTCALLSQLLPSVTTETSDGQLGAQVQDCVAQYVGITVNDCFENLVYDLKMLFQNEISFYQLMNSLNTIPDIDIKSE